VREHCLPDHFVCYKLTDKPVREQNEMQDLFVALGERNETSLERSPSPKATPDPSSGKAHKGAWTIAPQVYREAIARMAEVFRIVQADRGVLIPEIIRLFLSKTALESLYLHPNAWRHTCNADPCIDADAARIGEQIRKSLMEVLSNAEAESWTPNGALQVTFIGVLRYAHDHWCGIFPFCDRKPSPPHA